MRFSSLKNNLVLYFRLFVLIGLVFNAFYSNAFCFASPKTGSEKPTTYAADKLNKGAIFAHRKVITPLPKVSSIYDRLTFNWAQNLMEKGNQRPLQLDDLWMMKECKQLDKTSVIFEKLLENEVNKTNFKGYIEHFRKDNASNIFTEFWRSPVTRAVVKMYATHL
jgi:hypothetical protein